MDDALLLKEVGALFLLAAFVAGLINSFVLRSFPRVFKLKMLVFILLSAVPIAYFFLVAKNLFVTTVLVCAWAIGCIFLIVHYGAKNFVLPQDWSAGINNSRTPATMAALMLAVFTFILGFIITKLETFSYKVVAIGLLAPPLIGAISYIMSAYFVLASYFNMEGEEKALAAKRAVMWWEIGQLLLLSTIIVLIPFIGLLLDTLIKL